MRVLCLPADDYACGHFRVTWPAQAVAARGHDVRVQKAQDRDFKAVINADGRVVKVQDPDADVVVVQRVTHPYVVDIIELLRAKGVAVVVDVDDDLAAIHPGNPAFAALHPAKSGSLTRTPSGAPNLHGWHHLTRACQAATMVTVTTPALLARYARHGRGRVLPNRLPDVYYEQPRTDNATLGWPASLHSHPSDPDVVGPAVARLVGEGAAFRVVGDPLFTGRAFRLPGGRDAAGGQVDMAAYPAAVARLGIGIAPLADTRFNQAKSSLKPLELSALGVPWVGSPRAEYRRLHDLGCGVLADKPRTWYRELRRLVVDQAWRQELSDRGRAVAAGERLADHAELWWEAWGDALALQRGFSSVTRTVLA